MFAKKYLKIAKNYVDTERRKGYSHRHEFGSTGLQKRKR